MYAYPTHFTTFNRSAYMGGRANHRDIHSPLSSRNIESFEALFITLVIIADFNRLNTIYVTVISAYCISSNGRRGYNYFQVPKGCLFEGGYHLRYAYACIIVHMLCSASMASQVYNGFCFDSIVCGHHFYKTVWALQKAGESVSYIPQSSVTILRGIVNNLQLKRGVECSLLHYRGSGHSQSFAPCLALAAVIAVPLWW